jgi:hypothetical protein
LLNDRQYRQSFPHTRGTTISSVKNYGVCKFSISTDECRPSLIPSSTQNDEVRGFGEAIHQVGERLPFSNTNLPGVDFYLGRKLKLERVTPVLEN